MRIALATVLALALTTSARAQGAPPVRPAPAARRIGDAEVIGTIGAADANIAEAAKLATTKAQSADVRNYAKLVFGDDQRSGHQGLALAKTLHIAPALPSDSAVPRAHKQEMDQLNLISAGEFDKAFMQYMVADHKLLVNTIDSVLLPAVARREVRAFVERARPVVMAHEAQAQAWLDKANAKAATKP